MVCPKCGGDHVNVTVVNEVEENKKRHGVLYWVCFGWLWDMFLWIFLTLPKLIVALFGKKKKIVNKTVTYAVCQDCGHRWEVK